MNHPNTESVGAVSQIEDEKGTIILPCIDGSCFVNDDWYLYAPGYVEK